MELQQLNQKMDILNRELLEGILLKLPVKSLSRFKSVCKQWLREISDPLFIKNHLEQSTKDLSNHKLFVITSTDRFFSVDCAQQGSVNTLQASEIHFPFMELTRKRSRFRFLGCCGGLVCVLANMSLIFEDIFLLNPYTRESKKLPRYPFHPRQTNNVYGFGYCTSTGDYLVAKISITNERNETHLYSLKTNSWKRIQDCPFNLNIVRTWKGVAVDGKIHWIAGYGDKHAIASLDLSEENFQDLPFPIGLNFQSQSYYRLGVSGDQCLCVMEPRAWSFPFWVMKEYGIQESWMGTTVRDGICTITQSCSSWRGQTVFGGDKRSVVFLDHETSGCRGMAVTGLPITDSILALDAYVKSMVSLNSNNEIQRQQQEPAPTSPDINVG